MSPAPLGVIGKPQLYVSLEGICIFPVLFKKSEFQVCGRRFLLRVCITFPCTTFSVLAYSVG